MCSMCCSITRDYLARGCCKGRSRFDGGVARVRAPARRRGRPALALPTSDKLSRPDPKAIRASPPPGCPTTLFTGARRASRRWRRGCAAARAPCMSSVARRDRIGRFLDPAASLRSSTSTARRANHRVPGSCVWRLWYARVGAYGAAASPAWSLCSPPRCGRGDPGTRDAPAPRISSAPRAPPRDVPPASCLHPPWRDDAVAAIRQGRVFPAVAVTPPPSPAASLAVLLLVDDAVARCYAWRTRCGSSRAHRSSTSARSPARVTCRMPSCRWSRGERGAHRLARVWAALEPPRMPGLPEWVARRRAGAAGRRAYQRCTWAHPPARRGGALSSARLLGCSPSSRSLTARPITRRWRRSVLRARRRRAPLDLTSARQARLRRGSPPTPAAQRRPVELRITTPTMASATRFRLTTGRRHGGGDGPNAAAAGVPAVATARRLPAQGSPMTTTSTRPLIPYAGGRATAHHATWRSAGEHRRGVPTNYEHRPAAGDGPVARSAQHARRAGSLDAARAGSRCWRRCSRRCWCCSVGPLGPAALAAPALLLSLPRFSSTPRRRRRAGRVRVVIIAAFFWAERSPRWASRAALFGAALLIKLAAFARHPCAVGARRALAWRVLAGARAPLSARSCGWRSWAVLFVALWPWLWHDTPSGSALPRSTCATTRSCSSTTVRSGSAFAPARAVRARLGRPARRVVLSALVRGRAL